MKDGLMKREEIFDKMMESEETRKTWEMLCGSQKPMIPFIGAGVSAWRYSTWKDLLKEIVEKTYSQKCADIVYQALSCTEKPNVKNEKNFHWMEEIAECIFCVKEKYESSFMDENQSPHERDTERPAPRDLMPNPNDILNMLHIFVGNEDAKRKTAALDALYDVFNNSLPKEKGRMSEYQNYFPVLFPDILITTNYDNALEYCYPSILNYSYQDLNNYNRNCPEDKDQNDSSKSTDPCNTEHSWLYKAVSQKLKNQAEKLIGKTETPSSVTVPKMPMLLKVHGSIGKGDRYHFIAGRV